MEELTIDKIEIKVYTEGAEQAAKQMEKVADETKKVGNATTTAAHSATRATTAFSKFATSLGRIAMYRAIRTIVHSITMAFKEGLTNLYYWSQELGGHFAENMDKAASSVLQLKNGLAVAFAPILEALIPILQKVVAWIVAACNAISRFFAILKGASTYTAVNTDYTTKFGTALDKANGKAKELKKTLLGFDELNLLKSQNDNGGSGGANTPDYSDMFIETPTGANDINTDRIEKLQHIFENVKTIIETVTETIRYLAKRIWEDLNIDRIIDDVLDILVAVSDLAVIITEDLCQGIEDIYELISPIVKDIGDLIDMGLDYYLEQVNNAIDFWQSHGEDVVGIVTDLVSVFADLYEIIKSIAGYTGLDNFFDNLSQKMDLLWDDLGDTITFLRDITSVVKSTVSFIKNVVNGDFDAAFKDAEDIEKGFQKISEDVNSGVLEGTVDTMLEMGKKTNEGLGSVQTAWDVFKIAFETLKHILKGDLDEVSDDFGDTAKTIENDWASIKLEEFKIKHPIITWALKSVIGIVADILAALGLPTSLPDMKVDWRAKGGIVSKPTLIGAGEAGSEAIIPLENNTEWIDKVAERLGNGANGGTYNLTVELDGKVLAQKVFKIHNNQVRQTGVSPLIV